MKYTLRAFALGLLTATALLAFAYSQQDPSQAKETAPTKEEAASLLEEKGYTILTENEYTQLTEKASPEQNADSDEQQKQEDKEETSKPTGDEEGSVKAYTLSIEEGMVPEDISQVLAQNGIIEDAEGFRAYLVDNEFSRYIQIGEYTVVNQMSFQEIARIITR
ncbi:MULTISPECIES: endolytic transglycosylase MltG [Pontibacillus]|uniref:Endolytic transglycosylase MltG n=1 Tax=Pontibacillus chungwhensis TaxID=265426 RepID=A0ABY8UW17_9BACI|nr:MULTISPECIES: endolytic transglycosylase MltG [Pontibacillus]MCD5323577.1 endolytic transglycosylase MltG [Pontibacillus sp. HN14]WIF96946.1 endolytic transglycosylase MltG [Pontibacillus chungwhensis]